MIDNYYMPLYAPFPRPGIHESIAQIPKSGEAAIECAPTSRQQISFAIPERHQRHIKRVYRLLVLTECWTKNRMNLWVLKKYGREREYINDITGKPFTSGVIGLAINRLCE